MKRTLLCAVAALAIMAGPALAQGVTVDLTPQQRTTIKQYVVKERPAAVTLREKVTVGATIPAEIELRAVPGDWGPSVSRYRYIYHDDHVVFVDPGTRKVITVID